MEKQNRKVDEFFREELEHHVVVPTDAAKAAFLKEAATLSKTDKSSRKIFLYLSGIIILMLICIGIYISQPDPIKKVQDVTTLSSSIIKSKSPITGQKTNAHESNLPMIASLPGANPHSSYLSPNHKLQNRSLSGLSSSRQFKDGNSRSKTVVPSSSQKPSTIPGNDPYLNKATAVQENPVVQKSPEQITPVKKAADMVGGDTVVTLQASRESTPTPEQTENPKQKKKHETSGNPKNWNIDIGPYYSPEWMFNTLEGEKSVNNFGIEGTFHFGNYSIRTGAGLSITKGTNELSINYNDFLGNFNHLDSMSFVIDASHKIIPIYYFTSSGVWDSLMKTQYTKIIKRYTYLQVPFILGYDFWKNDHFSIGLRAGPILSVLIRTEQVSDNYDPGKNRIVQINMITPERIQTFWQFMGGVNASYSFSRGLGIELEPEIRYYFNSVYEKPVNNKKPWSAGFRVAFLIKN